VVAADGKGDAITLHPAPARGGINGVAYWWCLWRFMPVVPGAVRAIGVVVALAAKRRNERLCWNDLRAIPVRPKEGLPKRPPLSEEPNRRKCVKENMDLPMPCRRGFSKGVLTVLALAGMPLTWARAQEQTQPWEQTLKAILGDAKPLEKKVAIDMPEIAENGNTVPFSIVVDSPMTDADYVKAVHVIATANPQPGVATFHFTPQSGKAAIASRMRLAKTQDVFAIAELSDGKFLLAKRAVKVTIGGCGG
jgi:sulfur-oxidizing protein SoxY